MYKTVLITGASRGIGRAAALRFARAGWRVGVGYRVSETNMHTLVAELADLGRPYGCSAWRCFQRRGCKAHGA